MAAIARRRAARPRGKAAPSPVSRLGAGMRSMPTASRITSTITTGTAIAGTGTTVPITTAGATATG